MSTFPGTFQEIPKISVDRFEGKNLSSEVFFLSHFHSDHMVGLRGGDFHSLLRKRESTFIYCSELTALFLSQNHLKGFDEKIKILQVNKEQTISINEELGFLTVTALSAGHCPGSVMFLFNFKGLNYLYTGDLRMTRENLENMKALKNSDGSFKPIETLYLDTTFFQPVYAYLPPRDESISELIRVCRSWLQKGKDHVIDLRTPATIGVEFVLIAVYKEFGQPFHVSEGAYEKYSRIPELSDAISQDRNSQFHACIPGHLRNGRSLFRKHHNTWNEHNIFSVKLCALHARNFSKEKNLVHFSERDSLHRLVYSSHSSHGELVEMIETLVPLKIEPCVVPTYSTPEKVVEILQQSTNLRIQRSDSEEMPALQFSSYEDVADSESESDTRRSPPKELEKTDALLTLSKYNVKESSDEDELLRDESDEDELPPFRWDCFYDTSKVFGFQKKESLPIKRRKLDNA